MVARPESASHAHTDLRSHVMKSKMQQAAQTARSRVEGPLRQLKRSVTPGAADEGEGEGDAEEFAQVAPDLAGRQNSDADSNIEWNRRRWGQQAGWTEHDSFGYNWSSGATVHTASSIAAFMDKHLRPHLSNRYDLDILEISPGAGRVTVELIRYARSLVLVDLNQVPIDICRERLQYYPNEVTYIVNDGQSLSAVAGRDLDLVVSYDSLVHVHPSIVRGYMEQSLELLRPGGVLWFDHSGKGESTKGRRSAVTAEAVATWTEELGAELVEQTFRNDWDCLSVIRKR